MKTVLKKIIATISAGLLAFSFVALPVKSAAAETSQPIPIDMYLIAGQSNAAGYSTKGFKDLTETFENVGYGGEVQRNFRTDGNSASSYLEFEKFRWEVKAGLGSSGGYVGPEYGMAKAMNEQYANREDGRKAFIFKTAAGGTSLRDVDGEIGSTQGNWGNWYPRSLWPTGYAPDLVSIKADNDVTGYLYALFLENFEKVYNELKDNGYAPVVKGLAWMQGCQDLSFPTQYEALLKTFIDDIRADLAEITGDSGLNAMPFVIGKIATTFGSYNNPLVPAFNAVQQRVADDMGNGVETVETSDLVIVNQDGTYNGTDMYHFNCADAEKLGVRFGEKLLQLNGKKIAGIGATKNGKISYSFSNDGKLTVTVQPEIGEKKYRLSKLFVNEVDVTANVANNAYVIDVPADRTYITAEFIELTKYAVTYTMNEKTVGLVEGNIKVYENESLTFLPDTKTGYTITKVTANGAEIKPDANGVYTVENVTADVSISIETKKEAGDDSQPQPSQPIENGCFGSVSFAGLGAFCALGVCLWIKKRD